MDQEHLTATRRAGVLAPLFSLRSAKSEGIGDARDMELLVDWCRATGLSLVQTLPLNELLPPFFSPYQAASSFALEPAYLCLERVTGRRAGAAAGNCSHPRVDYRAKDRKLAALECFYRRDHGADQRASGFRAANTSWLEDFALFQVLKKHHRGAPWEQWEAPLRDRRGIALDSFRRAHAREINFQAWLQWLVFGQFCELKAYAARRGVLLEGDLPVLTARDSADVWAHREFFKLDREAGAPPDAFTPAGQRWGMPPYRWEALEAGGFRFLEEKLRYAGNFYDLVRVDHVVGLFRIWSVPVSEPAEHGGRQGFFDPPEESRWEGQGRKILGAMMRCRPPGLCAEDLGVVPEPCPRVLGELGIPGMEIMRWARDWQGTGRFTDPRAYRRLSVSALSTHDTSNFAAWWENEAGARERAQLAEILGLPPGPAAISGPAPVAAALESSLDSNSVFSVQLVFDWLMALPGVLPGRPADWRVNTPGTVGPGNWSTALPLDLEDLPGHPVTGRVRALVAASGRE